jgi:gamma-glutamylcyclotransferase (GGCT)/AIG2-like uncharacterized protein YtfP
VAVGPRGGVDDERGGVALEAAHLAQIEEHVEVALGVDDVPQDGVDALPVVEAVDPVDGDDDGAAGAADADAEPRCAVRDRVGVFPAWSRACLPVRTRPSVSARRGGNLSNLSPMDRLFVYGTLMPGEPLWPALAPFTVSWEAVTAGGRIWDTGHGYPAVRFDPGADPVPGVLVVLHPARAAEAVELLDQIENEGRLYRRVEVATSRGPAFAYEWLGPTDGLRPLAGGWRA